MSGDSVWKVRIGEETLSVDFEAGLSEPVDPLHAAEMAALLAQARSQYSRLVGEYRTWRAGAMLAATEKRSAKPIPEWKAKARVEASPSYQQYCTALSVASEAVGVLEAYMFGLAIATAPGATRELPGLPGSGPLPLVGSGESQDS